MGPIVNGQPGARPLTRTNKLRYVSIPTKVVTYSQQGVNLAIGAQIVIFYYIYVCVCVYIKQGHQAETLC